MDRASIFIIIRLRADSRYHEKGTMQLHVLEIGPLLLQVVVPGIYSTSNGLGRMNGCSKKSSIWEASDIRNGYFTKHPMS